MTARPSANSKYDYLANKYILLLQEVAILKDSHLRQEKLIEHLLQYLKLRAAYDGTFQIYRFKELKDLLPLENRDALRPH